MLSDPLPTPYPPSSDQSAHSRLREQFKPHFKAPDVYLMCVCEGEHDLSFKPRRAPAAHLSGLISSIFILVLGISGAGLRAQSKYETIKAFGFADQSSSWPTTRVFEGPEGALYGTTENGGSNNLGTVYRINKDGSGFSIIKSFTGTNDGSRPRSGLLYAADGLLYGTSYFGGKGNRGTVFRLNATGTTFETLVSFTGVNGASPEAELIQGLDGFIYGTTMAGSVSNYGTVFRLNTQNRDFATIKGFLGGDGANPLCRLVQGSDSVLYGTTRSGGLSNSGTIFRLNTDGAGYMVLKHFVGTNDGIAPYGGLVFGTNGALFGTTRQGGDIGRGTLFTINPDGGGYSVLKSFGGPLSDNGSPYDSLALVDNALCGITSSGGSGFGTVFRISHDGTDFRILKAFSWENGAHSPNASLYHATDGFLYGTTPTGGEAAGGTIFRLKPDGSQYSIVKSFNASGYDGSYPRAPMIRGLDGMLYGTTWSGGSNNLGTVFKIRPDGTDYAILKNFTPAEGESPYGRLLQTANGVLFGTLHQGGSGGHGAVFRINTNGTGFSVVKAFDGTPGHGYLPYGGLMQASDGMLYGTTLYGGEDGGLVFRLHWDGHGFTVINRLNDQTGRGGASCFATLIQGLDGALYGTTSQGGAHFKGTVFKLNLNGSNYTILRSFTGTNGDGAILHGSLLQTSDGKLYGVTESGGLYNQGTIFRMNSDGSQYEIIRTFTGADGIRPFGGLVGNPNGLLYGVTTGGGLHGRGTVFRLMADNMKYMVLHSFSDTSNVQGLLQTADGDLFGGTWGAGPMRYGTLFRLEPLAAISPLTFSGRGVRVHITGIPGRAYALQRALAITGPWATISTVVPDLSGTVIYEDGGSSESRCFYRTLH